MHFPKLTPLQSRFAASFAASCVLLILYFSFSNPHFAYAAEVDSITPTDHNHPLLLHLRSIEDELRLQDDHPFDGQDQRYEPDFEGLGRSIVGRQEQEIVDLDNNVPGNKFIGPGDQQYWRFSKTTLEGPPTSTTPDLPPSQGKRSAEDEDEEVSAEEIMGASELRRRQNTGRTLYLTLNVCDQPSPSDNGAQGPAPQLSVYVSQGSQFPRPGPDQTPVPITGGSGTLTMTASDDVFIGVDAPTDDGFEGNWNYELTASIDAPYAYYQDLQELYLVDSDDSSAFFVSTNLTATNSSANLINQWLKTPAPFGLFVHPSSDTTFSGILRSYCGLKKHAQIQSNFPQPSSATNTSKSNTNVSISSDGASLKQNNYLTGLTSNTKYYAIMAIGSNFTSPSSGPSVNGGGTVWRNISFTTKSDGNCQIPRNLSFCTSVNYAVPANPSVFATPEALGTWYDNQAREYYQFFNYSLDQIPCNTTDTARYSLAVGCQDCANAYKSWLCAVTMPRCMDYSSPSREDYLVPRNIYQDFINGSAAPEKRPSDPSQVVMASNGSRYSIIDQKVSPGPYKELLPCKQLCYGLVQSCPASLQFACPMQSDNLYTSYQEMMPDNLTGAPKCNMPGWVTPFSAGLGLKPGWILCLVGVLVALSGVGL